MKRIIFVGLLFLMLNISLVMSIELKINSPNNFTKVYNSTSLKFNLTTSNPNNTYDFSYTYDDNPFAVVKMCNRAKECVKSVRVNPGFNKINFRVSDSSGILNKTFVNIEIDTSKPKINSFSPLPNSFVKNDSFKINYTELNMVSIILYYGRMDKIRSLIKNNTNCFSGNSLMCSFNDVNLTEFNGEKINFWHVISNRASSISTQKRIVDVDLTAPNVTSLLHILQPGNRTKFIFDINEKNFKEITYKDIADCEVNVTSGYLCSRLKDGMCIAINKFCMGKHNLTITISDKAGNTAINYVNFTII